MVKDLVRYMLNRMFVRVGRWLDGHMALAGSGWLIDGTPPLTDENKEVGE